MKPLPLKIWGLFASGLLVLFFVGINGLAIMQGRAMTTLVSKGGDRTPPPEDLGLLAKSKILLTGVELPRPDPTDPPASLLDLSVETHHYPSTSGHTLEAWYIPVAAASLASPASPTLHTTKHPSTPTPSELFILFHPYGSSKISMVAIAQELHEMGHSVMLVDFYGSGGSSGTTTSIGYFESLDVLASVDYARQHWQPSTVQLYGASMGGAAVLRAVAVHGVDVEAIAIESAFDSLLNTVRNRFVAMGLPSTPLAELLAFWGGQQRGFNAFSHVPADYAKQVFIPTLVLHGQEDLRVTQGQSEAIYDTLRGWKHFSLYPGGGHGSSYQHDPIQWRHDLELLQNNQ